MASPGDARKCLSVNQQEFIALHAECTTITNAYLREAEKTSMMLATCTADPLNFRERFALLSQEILEKEAFVVYLAAKRFLHSVALLGYASVSTN